MSAHSEVVPSDLLEHIHATKGFMPEDEGELLHNVARRQLPQGPFLEVGTYCGKSALYLGGAAREVGGTVFTVDHHRGSEENQAGWEHHDTDVVDPEFGLMDTLPFFRKAIARAGLEDQVIALIGRSTTVSRWWRTPWQGCSSTAGTARSRPKRISPAGRRGSPLAASW
ncbi:class I SAM-dependent methyltransferase [Nocardioides alcanivorans]|uniref:class I SAM-dependent methyltransferase n=1 Tax=Nocardioides alcanivorans TaxID=2897352 RepID=UPI001F43F047|nr:class I SAM-dependent methyltransferase [Nocardioides alcanivorans]